MEHARLEKLRNKTLREEKEEEQKKKVVVVKDKTTQSADLGIKSCNPDPPFWWKQTEENNKKITDSLDPFIPPIPKPDDVTTYQVSYKRWQEEPNLVEFTKANADPCQRRKNLAL